MQLLKRLKKLADCSWARSISFSSAQSASASSMVAGQGVLPFAGRSPPPFTLRGFASASRLVLASRNSLYTHRFFLQSSPLCSRSQRDRPTECSPQGEAIDYEAIARIGALYGIEEEIRGKSVDIRRSVRQARAKPLLDDLHPLDGEHTCFALDQKRDCRSNPIRAFTLARADTLCR